MNGYDKRKEIKIKRSLLALITKIDAAHCKGWLVMRKNPKFYFNYSSMTMSLKKWKK